jgi:hypothetical protein
MKPGAASALQFLRPAPEVNILGPTGRVVVAKRTLLGKTTGCSWKPMALPMAAEWRSRGAITARQFDQDFIVEMITSRPSSNEAR